MILQLAVNTLGYILLGLLAAFCVLIFVYAVISFGPQFWTRRDRGGDARKGLAIWVEPMRFLGWHWGMRTAPKALRAAGFEGEFLYWKWNNAVQGTLVLPLLGNHKLTERHARRLADHIAARRRALPEAPIYLLGYSAGALVAARALELLPTDVQVESAALLAAAFDPRRDLSPAVQHVRNRLLVTASLADCAILGVGTFLFGTVDGRHMPAIGMVGYHGPKDERILEVHWRPRMALEGFLGQHDWCLSARFIVKYVAPALGVGDNSASQAAQVH